MKVKRPPHPKDYFEAAKDYQAAADHLMSGAKGLTTFDPVYFLYAHAIELALKSCLLANDMEPTRKHTIYEFFLECREKGCVGTDDADQGMINLVIFLGNANEHHECRYPPGKGPRHGSPSLEWTKDAVERIIAEVEPNVAAWMVANPSLPATKRSMLVFGKPTFTLNPNPPTQPGP